MPNATQLIGTWRLVSWEHRRPDGTRTYPMGKDAIGLITYTPDGFMFVSLMQSGRKNFASEGLFEGTDAEKKSAIETFIAYSGRYEVSPGSVTHHVEMSLFPNWIGEKLERFFRFEEDGRLTLSTPPFVVRENEEQTAHLIWERA